MMRSPRILVTALAIVFSAALVGCVPGGPSLDGTQWKLADSAIGSVDVGDVAITLEFANGQVAGNSGVNSFSGGYTQGPDDAFSVGQLASTLMAGPEPAMAAEATFLDRLSKAAFFKATDTTLTLFDKAGIESLSFEATTQ